MKFKFEVGELVLHKVCFGKMLVVGREYYEDISGHTGYSYVIRDSLLQRHTVHEHEIIKYESKEK